MINKITLTDEDGHTSSGEGEGIIPIMATSNVSIDFEASDITRQITSIKFGKTLINYAYKSGKTNTYQLSPTIKPADSDEYTVNRTLKWTSSNTKYATVNSSGKVTFKKAGLGKTVTITAKATDGSGKKASIKLRICNPVTKITISGSKTVAAGKAITLKASVSPAKATVKTLKWTSSNTKYATVSTAGKVTGKKAGKGKTVTITATATDGSGKKATYKVKIK